jgi:hypothetical protein
MQKPMVFIAGVLVGAVTMLGVSLWWTAPVAAGAAGFLATDPTA